MLHIYFRYRPINKNGCSSLIARSSPTQPDLFSNKTSTSSVHLEGTTNQLIDKSASSKMAVLHPMYNQKPSDNNDNKSQTEIDNNPNAQPQPHVRADDKNTFTAGVPLLVIQNDTANEDDSKLPNMLSTTTIHPVPSTHGSSTTDGDGSSSSTGEGDGVSSLATEDTTPMTSSLHGGFNNGNNGNRCGEGIFIDTDGIAKVLMGNGIDADGKKKVNGTFLTLLTKPDYIQGMSQCREWRE